MFLQRNFRKNFQINISKLIVKRVNKNVRTFRKLQKWFFKIQNEIIDIKQCPFVILSFKHFSNWKSSLKSFLFFFYRRESLKTVIWFFISSYSCWVFGWLRLLIELFFNKILFFYFSLLLLRIVVIVITKFSC